MKKTIALIAALAVFATVAPVIANDDFSSGPLDNGHGLQWGDKSVQIIGDAYNETLVIKVANATVLSISAAGVITGTLADSSIDTAKIATDAVTTTKIINTAVDTAKIAADAVTTVKVINAAINTFKLATDSVVTAKIANNAVDSGKIQLPSDMATGGVLCKRADRSIGQCSATPTNGVCAANCN